MSGAKIEAETSEWRWRGGGGGGLDGCDGEINPILTLVPQPKKEAEYSRTWLASHDSHNTLGGDWPGDAYNRIEGASRHGQVFRPVSDM